MFWKLALTRQYTWLNNRDASSLLLPWFQLQASELQHWALTLWDPYQWCGQPLLGQGQAGTAYPLNWLLWALPLRHGWVRHMFLNWYLILIHFQAALFAYWLCRDLLRSAAASLLAGLAFSLGPLLGTADWPSTLNAAVWVPLLFLFYLRADRLHRPLSSALFCGGALGISWLSGNGQIPLLLSLIFTGLWLWWGWRTRLWVGPFLFALAAIGVSALQWFAALEYVAQSPAEWWTFAVSAWKAHSVAPLSIAGVLAPQYAPDAMIFVGITVLTFAVAGFVAGHRSRQIQLLAGTGLLGFLLCFGEYFILEGVLYGIGGLAQEPKSGLAVFGLSAAVLSAFGLDACRKSDQAAMQIMQRLARVLAILSAVCSAALFLLAMTNGQDLKKFTPIALCAIAAILVAGLLEGWRRGALSPRSASVCAILLAMWEFGNVAGSNWENVEFGWGWLTQLEESSDATRFLRTQGPGLRVAAEGLPYNFGDWTGVPQFGGWSGGTDNVVRASVHPSARSLAGVRFLVSRQAQGNLKQVFDSPRGLKVFEVPDAAPPAFVVHQAVTAKNRNEIDFLLSRSPGELRKQGFVEGTPPKLDVCEGTEPVDLPWRSGRSIRVRATLRCTGLLVLGQTWYPGWRVTVDAKPSTLYQAYGFLQATVVPAGTHEITFTYTPTLIWAGAALTLLSLTCLAIVAARSRRQS